ncbi:hypothetical protein TNCV_2959071 [Trichonephila clavipes]|nr:hypothetical protein TNCV_2959071 [Trichonephila clavipes]
MTFSYGGMLFQLIEMTIRRFHHCSGHFISAQYRDKTSATAGHELLHHTYKKKKKIKEEFADRFEDSKPLLAFIVNPLNTNSNEIHIEAFGIDSGSLEMQLDRI